MCPFLSVTLRDIIFIVMEEEKPKKKRKKAPIKREPSSSLEMVEREETRPKVKIKH